MDKELEEKVLVEANDFVACYGNIAHLSGMKLVERRVEDYIAGSKSPATIEFIARRVLQMREAITETQIIRNGRPFTECTRTYETDENIIESIKKELA